MQDIVFFVLSALTLVSALLTVVVRNPVHSVLAMIMTFFMISGHYVLLNAQFLAVVNLIVYAGAIMVLFLFVLMLLNLNTETEPQKSFLIRGLAAAISVGLLFVTLTAAFKTAIDVKGASGASVSAGLVADLGKVLFSQYVVPFEISSILFLAAMVGAVMIGKRKISDSGKEEREFYL